MSWQQFISPVCISLAAICNAIMDCIENEHIAVTVFNKLDPNFWNKRVSWNKAKRIGGYKFDAWHIFKSLMLGLWCCSIIGYRPLIVWWTDFLILGTLWILTFNLFYNNIFKR